jgi:hypothetical protein
MSLPVHLLLENSQSWFRWYKEYNIVCTSFEDQLNLKQKMSCPDVIDAIRVWMKSNDDYYKKKREYDVNKTSEGWEVFHRAEWYRSFNVNKVILLVEGRQGFPIGNYEEWLIQKKKKLPNELPDDVLSIIRAYSKPAFRWYKEYNEAKSLFAPNFSSDEFIKLKKKMDEPTVREQVKMCIDAYKQGEEAFQSEHQIDCYCKEAWWFSVSIKKLVALIYDQEYRVLNYAEWVFKDDIDDAWMDSDNEYDFNEDLQYSLQEELMADYESDGLGE